MKASTSEVLKTNAPIFEACYLLLFLVWTGKDGAKMVAARVDTKPDEGQCLNSPLRNLCVLGVSAVYLLSRHLHRRVAEDAEVAQREFFN